MHKSILLRGVCALLLSTVLIGCEKHRGDAEVITKDYVAAVNQGEKVTDERASSHEQWIVKVRMLENRRLIEVRAERGQWERLHPGDRVKVTYQIGKYTGAIWNSEVD